MAMDDSFHFLPDYNGVTMPIVGVAVEAPLDSEDRL